MNYLSAPLPPPRSPESLGNCKLDSSFSSRKVYTNAAYDYVDSDYGSTGYGNDYEELQNVRNEAKATSVPRKKTNDLYESPQSHRKRQITECSDDSIPSAMSTEIIQVKRDTCLNKLILFLILAVSVAALVLVILVILNIIGPKCSCSQGIFLRGGSILIDLFKIISARRFCINLRVANAWDSTDLTHYVLFHITSCESWYHLVRSCTYAVVPADYQLFIQEMKKWYFYLKSEKQHQYQLRHFQ